MAEHRVAVMGAAGYGGALCAAIVNAHPSLELTTVTARSDAGKRHDDLYPRYRVPLTLDEPDPDRVAEQADAALVAYPHRAAAQAVRELRSRGLKVVDLSADFRLGQDAYERWYQPHEAPELLGEAVYGLPELGHREQIAEADLVAGPGCNSTAALLALWPLRDIATDAVVDIKTGVSGAGREATQETHFVSATDNVNPYKTEGHRHVAELQQELPDRIRFSFVPHLLPIDQGLMASCFVTVEGEPSRDDVVALFEDAYARRAVRGGGLRAAAHRAREGHQPGARLRDRGRGRAGDGLLGHRQPLEGRLGPGGAGPQPDAGPARGGGADVSFFRSRWVQAPAHARELDPHALPAGFRAAGVAAGLKPDGLDVGVLVSDSPETTSAARFTTNARVGAPVLVSREARLDGLRAVVANSGGSNVGDGQRGIDTALATQAAAAEALGLEPAQVGLASTGVIGTELPRDRVVSGAREACAALGDDADAFSKAILTSDSGPKRACLEVELSAGTVRLSAQAKGAGMIEPRFATMFCFVQTDAELSPETLDLLTGVCVKRSFDRISVDGQLSTSDTVYVQAGGASGVGVDPETADERALGEAMDALMRQLALEIVADGEGAERVGRVVVNGRAGATEVGGARRGELAAGQDRAARRGPQLRAHPPGRRRGVAAGRAVRGRPGDRGPPAGERRRRGRCRARGALGPRAGGERPRGRVRADPGRGGRGDRGLLLRPLGGIRELQRGVHQLMRDVATLLEALPYIREFHGQTVVIKYGGAAMTDAQLKEEFARDVVLLKYVGMNPVVVHGGGPDITAYMERLGMDVRFEQGLRVSDEATVEVAKMVLVGKQNKDIVLRLGRHGQPAVGLCGDDGMLFRARKQLAGETDIGFVGEIESVNVDVINHIAEDYIPVIASVGADGLGNSYNINADAAAAAVAAALGAAKVLFLTDVEGWRADPEDPGSLISEATVHDVRERLDGVAGGMRPKLEACVAALTAGVRAAHIVDGREEHSLLLELFTDKGIGTKLWP